jgi:hypothetical protein
MLGAAAPAGAAQIGIVESDNGPVPAGGPTRAVLMNAGPDERNDVTVRASDLGATDQGLAPLTVTVTDPGATFDTTLPSADSVPCEIVDAHTARCHVDAGAYFTQAIVVAGDRNDRLRFAPDSAPLRERFVAGDGNDDFETGLFVGDASYRWASDMGAGNDTVHVGPSTGTLGLGVYAGSGNDTVYGANGARDVVDCGLGQDTFVADPYDEEWLNNGAPPEPCEKRLAPQVLDDPLA